MRYLAIIPARGGSRGIPRKNVRLLGGKPLIAWTIEAAASSEHLDRIVVSTEDPEIRGVAEASGAEVPVLRPPELAADDSPTIDCVLHMMTHLSAERDRGFDALVVLQPTSPFRVAGEIDRAVETLEDSRFSCLASYVRARSNPFWMVRKGEDGEVHKLLESQGLYQRQKLPVVYEPNGAIYINTWDVILRERALRTSPCLLFEMESRSSVDLDTYEDWDYAEYLLERGRISRQVRSGA